MNKFRLRVDYNNMMAGFVGEEQGIKESELNALKKMAEKAYFNVQNTRGKGMTGWMELPYNQAEIVKDINDAARNIAENYEYFVVLGIGGSALGPTAVFQALCHMRHNDLSREKRGGAPKFYVEDNVDPERMKALLDVIDIKKTMFNVITKSGATSETMSQYLIIADILKGLGLKLSDHIIATTDSKKGNLIKIAKENGLKTFFIPDGVGGRFSQLCPVGLLPAAVLGIDIEEMLAGAAYMDEICKERDMLKNPALVTAALQYLAMKKGKNISVMMPYADSLKYMSDWYCQLWGESLGKSHDLDGNAVYVGQTPVKALGVTDQHSQVQLYVEGPFDKVITILAVDEYRENFAIPHGCEDIPDVSFLGGHSLNELITAERVATEYALTKANRLNFTIYLPKVNAFTIGQLLFYYEMQTAYCGAMLNIDTYNQPGVEGGKDATYALLGKSGYENKKTELDDAPTKKTEYIC